MEHRGQKKVYIKTWGCQMNFHDSERILGQLKMQGFVPVDTPEEADFIVFNTCTVREKAEQKFMSEVGRLKRFKQRRPDVKIAVAGCVAQQKGESIVQRMPHVDYVVGPQNISRVGQLLQTDRAVLTGDNPFIAEEETPVERSGSVTAWVNIMYGCNNFCSYCIVPYTRGRERSRPPESILNEIEDLVKKGFKEVVLLGQNVNSYRGGVSFAELLEKVNAIEDLSRIRFVTSHPKDLNEDLIRAMAELEKVCEHIHLPLQSGSDRILALMNRKYTYNEYVRKVQRLRELIPEIAITTDIIAGFPTETEEDHRATVRALQEIEFDGIFAFKFSPRPMTKAAEMDGQLPEQLKAERLTEILSVQDSITEKKNRALEGTLQEVLVEGPSETDKTKLTGRTRTNKIVNFTGNSLPGTLIMVKITKGLRHSLEGKVEP